MSDDTLVRWAPSTTIVSTRSIGPPGTPGPPGPTSSVETLSIESSVDQTGLTAATTISNLGSMAPSSISDRPQEILIKIGKIRLTSGAAPLGYVILLYEDPVGTIVDSVQPPPITATTGVLNSSTPPLLFLRRTAAQLVGKTYRVQFLPLNGGTWSVLGSNISNKVSFKEV